MVIRTWIWALLVSAPVAATAEEEPVTVSFEFGWTPGMTATVASNGTRTRKADVESTVSGDAVSRMVVTDAGERLRVEFEDMTVDADLPDDAGSRQAALMARIGEMAPDYFVTKTGEFVGIHDVAGLRGKLESLLHSLLPEGGDAPAVNQVMGLMTEPALTSKAAEMWNAQVGFWAGASLELGAVYRSSERAPVPIFPGEDVQLNTTFSAVRMVPCPGGGGADCVELEMLTTTDAEDAKRLVDSIMDRLKTMTSSAVPPMEYRSIDIRNELRVVTEPATLKPHSMTSSRTFAATVFVEGAERSMSQADARTTTFTYE